MAASEEDRGVVCIQFWYTESKHRSSARLPRPNNPDPYVEGKTRAASVLTRRSFHLDRDQWADACGTSRIARRFLPLLRSLGGQHEEMVQSGRYVRQIYQPRDLRADGLLATSSVSTEMAEPVRVGRDPYRRDTIVRSERMPAEHAGRVLVGGRGFPLVGHSTLTNACARPNATRRSGGARLSD